MGLAVGLADGVTAGGVVGVEESLTGAVGVGVAAVEADVDGPALGVLAALEALAESVGAEDDDCDGAGVGVLRSTGSSVRTDRLGLAACSGSGRTRK